ncbi:hypothetical protein F4811DRAFT_571870 [Daldinia bambusicola]|nr:hypothetical protein F4811DRAFT_571870 [Daldinia bambusicola]
MSRGTEVSVSCLCGAAKQTVVLRSTESESGPLGVDLCHCYDCRHISGVLCLSYAPIKGPQSLNGLVVYLGESTQSSTAAAVATPRRYFCDTCGCHVFRCSADGNNGASEAWEVATGTIIGRIEANGVVDEEEEPLLRYARHINIKSTKDGGLSPFIKLTEEAFPSTTTTTTPTTTSNQTIDRGSESGSRTKTSKPTLEAHCHCKTVQFFITRPNASSFLPHSGFSDLIAPFTTSPKDVAANPQDEKWWLRPRSRDDPSLTRYMAGTCGCRSCRLACGFEIQTWAFVPRGNIFLLPPAPAPSPAPTSSPLPSPPPSSPPSSPAVSLSNPPPNALPLDFPTLQSTYSPRPLRTYESSPGVFREFCPRCGASVFWHDTSRPELIDVSVGLLAAAEEEGEGEGEGARAEKWLDWWWRRVSFQEDAGNGRLVMYRIGTECI